MANKMLLVYTAEQTTRVMAGRLLLIRLRSALSFVFLSCSMRPLYLPDCNHVSRLTGLGSLLK